MILIVSSEQDEHTQAVLRCLKKMRKPATLLDLAHFPQQSQLAMNFGARDGCQESILSNYEGDLCFSACRAVWWRRPRPFLLHPEMTDKTSRTFAYTECMAAISGLWLALDAFWVNHPMREEEALRKAYQLKVAQQVGLNIPHTLITNNPNRARAFVYRHGFDRTVYKSFSAGEQSWHETTLAQTETGMQLDKVCYAPVIFQERIPTQVDLRVVVISGTMFPIAIGAHEHEQTVEHRMTVGRLRGASFELPATIIERIHLLMQRLGLVYGVVDLRLTPDGQYIFQDINPSGSWLWLEECTNLPMTQTFASFLASQDEQKSSAS
ncbi:MAG: hypothetical protein NT075_36025 [Chloroflexi bacterium]|nr:hypothetical protein [Chloroflexota bacterium]